MIRSRLDTRGIRFCNVQYNATLDRNREKAPLQPDISRRNRKELIFFLRSLSRKAYIYVNRTKSARYLQSGHRPPPPPCPSDATGKWLRHAARPQDTVASTLTCSLPSPSVSHRQRGLWADTHLAFFVRHGGRYQWA